MRTLAYLRPFFRRAAPAKAPRPPSDAARPPRWGFAFAVALAASGCGGGQTRGSSFDPRWVDDHGASMAAFQASFRQVRVAPGADVAVGVIGKTALVGVALTGGPPWTFAHVLHGRPAVAGSVVVGIGGGELFAVEARTGALLWSRPSAGHIRGAGDDGVTTVVSLVPASGAGSVVLAIARDGSVLRQIEESVEIGVPAVVGDTAFFPWQGRFLSAYDIPSGEERARVLLPDRTSRAFAVGGAVFAGEASVTRFDDRIRSVAQRPALTLPPPLGGLPRAPAWMRSGTEWINREGEATDRINVYARPTASGPMAIDGGHFVVTYFRLAVGLDATSGALAWAHAHRTDFLGGAAYHGGFALCDTAGNVTFLDGETGAVAASVSLGKPVDACVVQADALTRPSATNAASRSEQVTEILRLRDARLSPVQSALVRELSRADDRGATHPAAR